MEDGIIEAIQSCSSSVNSTLGVKTATFYQWKYNHYFTVVEDLEGAKNMRARCTLCSPSSKPLSCAKNTTSNFKKHLHTVHKTTELKAIVPEELQDGRVRGKRKRVDGTKVQKQTDSKRQCTLITKMSVSADTVRTLVAEYVISNMLPLSTVESPAFKKLIEGISLSVDMPSRKSLVLHLDKACESMMAKLTLEEV